jgi:zinc protease
MIRQRLQARRLRNWAALATALSCAVRLTAQGSPPVRPLAYTRVVLPNGLVAIFNEDHAAPLVAVNVWYHVGSKDDPPGRAGLAHLCEHLMAQGSTHLPQQQQLFYRSLGGTSTHWAETLEDVTKFYVVVPSNQLETVLWAESDRMAAPLARIDAQRVSAVQAIIAQERRQNVENATFGVSRELTLAALYPAGHPYHASSLPPSTDLYADAPDVIRSTCGGYYVPNNAVITLSGDFDAEAARRLVERYFGDIPRGQPVRHEPAPMPRLAGERRLVLEDSRATQPQLHLDWIGASYANSDRQALLALASALSEDRFGQLSASQARFGRLSKLLVRDRQLATAVFADNYDLEQSGVFEIAIFPRPGASLTLIEALVDSTLMSLKATPVTRREIARFNAANAVEAAASLQTKFARADTLAHDQVFAGDPVSYARQAAAASRLTPADVQRAARQYLTPGRVVMSLVPGGKVDLASRPDLPYVNVTPAVATPTPAKP